VAGIGGIESGPGHAVIYFDGAITDLGTLGGTSSVAYGINNTGQVTGQAYLSGDTIYHAFVYANGSMQDLGTLGAPGNSVGHGINSAGDVTGQANQHAFLYAGGTMKDLGTLGAGSSEGWSINDAGQIVGDSATASGATHAFLDSNGMMQDLNSLLAGPNSGWMLESATGINNSGQIAGYGTLDGQEHAFLLTPTTPEPGSGAVLAIGAIVLLARRHRN
jgi:probable HAF family extracellular repeat protein